jgi:hypothetical protein
MPRREVVFTGLFAFGAGVAVGANWPKASNIVGYILNRLGFELADLAIWMWDPEKTALLNQETSKALPARSKRKAKVLRSRTSKSERASKKSKKGGPSPRARSQAIIVPVTRRKGVNGHEGRNGKNHRSISQAGIRVESRVDQPVFARTRVTPVNRKTPQPAPLRTVKPRQQKVRTRLGTVNLSSSPVNRATSPVGGLKAKKSVPTGARKAPTARGSQKKNRLPSSAGLEAAALN